MTARNNQVRVTVGANTRNRTIASKQMISMAALRQIINVAMNSDRSATPMRKTNVAPPNASAAPKSTKPVSHGTRKKAAAHSAEMRSNQFCSAARTAGSCRSRTIVESPMKPETIPVAQINVPYSRPNSPKPATPRLRAARICIAKALAAIAPCATIAAMPLRRFVPRLGAESPSIDVHLRATSPYQGTGNN